MLKIGNKIVKTLERFIFNIIEDANMQCSIYLYAFDYGKDKNYAINS
jgi:hypothetical protein